MDEMGHYLDHPSISLITSLSTSSLQNTSASLPSLIAEKTSEFQELSVHLKRAVTAACATVSKNTHCQQRTQRFGARHGPIYPEVNQRGLWQALDARRAGRNHRNRT
jgi:hypothetical protein